MPSVDPLIRYTCNKMLRFNILFILLLPSAQNKLSFCMASVLTFNWTELTSEIYPNAIMIARHMINSSFAWQGKSCVVHSTRESDRPMKRVRMSPVQISLKPTPFTHRGRSYSMSLNLLLPVLLVCCFIRRCRTFNPSQCRLSPFHLYVVISMPRRLSKITLT